MDWQQILGADFAKLVVILLIVTGPAYLMLLRDGAKGHNQLTSAIEILTKTVEAAQSIIKTMADATSQLSAGTITMAQTIQRVNEAQDQMNQRLNAIEGDLVHLKTLFESNTSLNKTLLENILSTVQGRKDQ